MKKLLIGFLILAVFGIYSWHEQQEGASVQVGLQSKNNNNNNNTANSSSSNTQSSNTNSSSSDNSSTVTPTTQASSGFKDGTYTGDSTDAFYGNVQVQVAITGGKITNVQFLQYPNDRGESVRINNAAMPLLSQEAIQAQNANVDIISGATQTSQAFQQSLQSALSKAQS